ncbi:unnamed protein product [Penicillium salamii]|nr:unnamed protein product [Penicillium salamii]
MVYCGKPSLSCDRCSPSCTQCIRAKVECPGYQDLLDWSFRDQTDDVIYKSQRSARRKRTAPSLPASTSSSSPSIETYSQNSPALPSLQKSLVYPVEEQAKAHFFTHYMSGGPCGGHMSYLLPLTKHRPHSAVNTALTAVGLAALSNIRMSPRMMLKARQVYTTALSQTNHALKTPALSKRDDILAAVVLLGMFEVMTCSDNLFIDRWMKHIEGAAKLIECRGSEQLSRSEGLELFTNLRAQITLSSIYQEKYSSPIMTQLTQDAKQHRNPDDRIIDEVSIIVVRLNDLCAALKDGTLTQPSEIIRRTLSLDADLVSLLLTAPPTWSYTTVKVPLVNGEPITNLVWGDSYHVYRNLAVSSMWNNARSARILMHEMILEAGKLLEESSPVNSGLRFSQVLANQSRDTARRLVDDVCASVPFHMGMGVDNEYDWNVSGYESTITPPSFEISGAGGVALMWPLLIAANCGLVSLELRQWITGCLEKIGYSMGIQQALAMAQLLQNGMHTRAWITPDGSPAESATTFL